MPRFVPCRVSHLTEALSELLPEGSRASFFELARVVEDLYHHYGAARARLVGELYAPFDPDAETVPPARIVGERPLERLYERLGQLLEAGNFQRVPDEVLLTPADQEVLRQLQIDPDLDAIEHIAVYHRGLGKKGLALRSARRLFRLVEVEVPAYRRVVVVVRTTRDPTIILKLFKDVPCQDLELLLPTVRVKMKLLDKLKLSGSGGAAAVSAWKLLRAVYSYTPGLAKLLAIPFKIVLLPVFLLVGGIYGGKTLLDYSKIRASYVTALAEHLYAITMASNLSVISRLSAMAGEEDTKEVLLAYALLLHANGDGLTPEELQARAEAFVWDRYRATMAFDVHDALSKLDDLAVCWREPGGRRRAVPVEAALRNVDRTWDEAYAPPEGAAVTPEPRPLEPRQAERA